MHAHERCGIEQALERAEGDAHDVRGAGDVQFGAVVGGLDPVARSAEGSFARGFLITLAAS